MARFHTGDTTPPLTGVCLSDGIPTSIVGSSVAAHIRKPSGLVLTKEATITDGPNGAWSAPWTVGDLDEDGRWVAEAEVTFAGGAVQTFGPVVFYVDDQVA